MQDTLPAVADFFGARAGRTVGSEGEVLDLITEQVGLLSVPSGMLGVVDPFASLESPLGVRLEEPGRYPVILTSGTYPNDYCELSDAAYLSVVLAEGDPVSVEPLSGTVVDGRLYGVTTWGGDVGFVDARAALGHVVPTESELFEGWVNLSRGHPHGLLDTVLPWAVHGENVIGVMTPNDGGAYPLYVTRDATGAPLGVHVDFQVAGEGRHQLEVIDWPPPKP